MQSATLTCYATIFAIALAVLGLDFIPELSGCAEVIGWSTIAMVMTFSGVFGNKWYLNHALGVISELRKRQLGNEDYFQELTRRGGVNASNAKTAFRVFVAAFSLLVFLLLKHGHTETSAKNS